MTTIELASLDVLLYGEHIGTIVQFHGEQNLFTFTDRYIEDSARATLSMVSWSCYA